MLTLYAYALDPVSEATADKKSFFSRKGRSHFDFHANILAAFQGENPPAWVVVCDVKSFYSNVVHEWLFANIPMDTNVLREFLRAGVIKDGDLFDTTQGISKGAALSSILGNMILDGLQPFIYDRLYPKGNANFQNGNLIRFCDDIIITATSKTSAQLILQVVGEFLAERGLSFNWEKTHITHIENGFEVLSRRYQRISGILTAHPSKRAVAEFEREMEGLILNFKGTQRDLIDKINQKLTGFATYHRVTDAFHAFRRIDTTVNGLLIRRMCDHYKRWSQDAVLSRFWINDGGDRIFALPDDPTVRVAQLALLGIVFHRTCKADFNPYLDEKYFQWLQSRRAVQKATGIYGAIWSRQGGRCAYCKQQMLPDQEVRVVEKIIGRGHTARNLQYIHERCAFDTYSAAGEGDGEGVDLFELLDDIVRREPRKEPPYLELREYFRLSQKPAFTLTFKQIERILGDHLPWEAYFHKAFWYEETPNLSSLLWENESFPMEYFSPSEPDYCISDSWISQGYKIKTLYLESRRVVFRQEIKNTTGFIPPKALTRTRLDDELNYKLQQILKKFIKEHGL